MRCINPVRIKNPSFPEDSTLKYLDCACGKCFNCLVNKRRMWYFRLFHESVFNSGSSWFVGLDYAPQYCDFELHKDHLQKFFKRLRKYGLKFKYYSIGEFGTDEDSTHRPHYHVLFFFDKDYSYEYVQHFCSKSWKFGRVDVGRVEPASINYVLHYHVRPKYPFGKDDSRKTFAVCSQGLGLSFLEHNFRDVVAMLGSSSGRKVSDCFGDSFVLPRYYVKKLKDYGVDVVEFDGSNVDWSRDSLRDIIDTLDSTLEYYSDGRVKESSVLRWNSLVADIILDSKRKLDKYNTQSKLHNK